MFALGLSSRGEFQEQTWPCCDRSDSRGRGESQRGALEGQGFVESARKLGVTLGWPGPGGFVRVVLINNLGERPFSPNLAPLPQRVGLDGLEQKEVECRWAVGAVSEGSDR